MQEEVREYATFTTMNKEGVEIEMAVMDEFQFEHKNYVVGALVEGDLIKEEGLFIFRLKEAEDSIEVEKIDDAAAYERIAKAYMEMED
ncbi:MAG: DUF1292 domain-containing protein [Lachnospiraceae bacterium]|nr:DUF1292 domain-containing protein [Lachnospiraceae bacterium]